MARFNAEGIEGLALSLEEFSEIPDNVVEDILQAGADVVIEEQKRVLKAMGLYDTKALHDSIVGYHKAGNKRDDRKRYVLVYPYGDRKAYTSRFRYKYGYKSKNRKARWYKTGGKRKITTNNDVGFIHEFGAPRRNIEAKQWMRQANINAEEDMVRAEAAVYDRWLASKDL